MNGRRLLVLTSSGFLLRPGVPPELQSFIDAALRSDIVVDAISAEGLETRAGGPKELLRKSLFQMPLDNITIGTGGHYFKDSNDYAGAMAMATNPEVSYVLAFHPASVDGKFHTLKIRFLSKRSDALQFRPGYFSPDPKKQVSARSRMDDAVFSEQSLHEIPAGVTVTAGEAKGGVTPLSIRVHVDVKVLQFTSFEGRHVQQLVFVTALLGPDGSFVTGEESIMDLALSDQKLASLQETGLTVVATLKSPAGAFRVRTIVREGGKGHLAALSQPVEIQAK